jgi:hypothetical protein
MESNECIISSIEKYDNNISYCQGYKIETSSGYININISTIQDCCEQWCISSSKNNKNYDNNFNELIGKKIVNIQTENTRKEDNFSDKFESILYVKITLEEDPYPFVICLYNQHNGFYSHNCLLDWNFMIGDVAYQYCDNKYI